MTLGTPSLRSFFGLIQRLIESSKHKARLLMCNVHSPHIQQHVLSRTTENALFIAVIQSEYSETIV